MLGAIGEYETDGGLLHLRRDAAGKVVQGCAVEATYLAPVNTTARPEPALISFG